MVATEGQNHRYLINSPIAGQSSRKYQWKMIALCLLIIDIVPLYAEESNTSQHYQVSGQSMQPTLQPADRVHLIPVAAEQLKKGNLVAIRFKTRKRLMVKRLIAEPGDKVLFINGQLFLNDKPLNSDWWPEDKRLAARQYKLLSLQLSRYDNRIPAGTAMVMGDGSNSFDSGDYGLISLSQIAGRIEKTVRGSSNE